MAKFVSQVWLPAAILIGRCSSLRLRFGQLGPPLRTLVTSQLLRSQRILVVLLRRPDRVRFIILAVGRVPKYVSGEADPEIHPSD